MNRFPNTKLHTKHSEKENHPRNSNTKQNHNLTQGNYSPERKKEKCILPTPR